MTPEIIAKTSNVSISSTITLLSLCGITFTIDILYHRLQED